MSLKSKPSIYDIKWMTFPPAPQPKQWNICLSGETAKEGDFSLWNGHNPKKFLPLLFNVMYLDITSTISLLDLISSISSSLYLTNFWQPFYILFILFDIKCLNPSLLYDKYWNLFS